MKTYRILGTSFLLLLLTFTTGCVSLPQTEPFYVSDNFLPGDKQKIILLPAVNLGRHEDLDTELDSPGIIKSTSIDRGYTFVDRTKSIIPNEVTSASFDKKDFKWIEKMGLTPDSWAMIVAVDYLTRSAFGLGGSKGNAYVTGYLVEYPSGKLLWEDFGYGTMGAGFLLKALVDDEALGMATREMMQGLPPAKGKITDVASANKRVKGECPSGACENSNSDSNICVLRDKSTAFLDEDDEEEDGFDTGIIKRPLYDGTIVIAEDLRAGQHKCFSKGPGKTFLHIEEGRPAFFRAKAGHKYFFNAKFDRNWVFEEVPSNEWEQTRLTQKAP